MSDQAAAPSPAAAELERLAALPPFEYDQQRRGAAIALGVKLRTLDQEVEKRRPTAGEEPKANGHVPGAAGDAIEISRLAALDLMEYDRERKDAAKALGISVAALDKEVRRAKARATFNGESGPDVTAAGWIDPHEDGVAKAFAESMAGLAVFDHTAGEWRIWRDGRWALDGRETVFNAGREFTRTARARLQQPPPSMTKIAFCANVEKATRADPRIAVSHEVWDTDPWLLGVPGGVVNLKTGETFAPEPSLYISRQTLVAPAPKGSRSELWERFLDEATGRDGDTKEFLQRLCGYLLTGEVNEEILAFLYGPGGTGKGVFIKTVVNLLGDYAVAVPIEVFTAASRINLEYYRATMAGARLVAASETEQAASWAASAIKEMTGNENPLSARHPYGRPFTFRPGFKIIIIGNHAPRLSARSEDMERRLRVVPFDHKPERVDEHLKLRLRPEYPRILRWMIDGCLIWQQVGIGTSARIRKASSSYFKRQDGFQRFIEERCILGADLNIPPGLLLSAFNAWCRENAEEPVSGQTFAEAISRKEGLFRKVIHGKSYIRGIGLKPPNREKPPVGAVDGEQDDE